MVFLRTELDSNRMKIPPEKVLWAWEREKELVSMGREARVEYETKYAADRNYRLLMDVYEQARENSRKEKA